MEQPDHLLHLAQAFDGDTRSALKFDDYFRAVNVMVDEAGPEVCLEAALRASASASVALLRVALDVPGVLVDRQPALLPLLLSVTGKAFAKADEDVWWAVANALDHGDDARVLPQLLQLGDEDDPHIRWKVVCALPALVDEAQATLDQPAVQALLAAFQDDDPNVRGWAGFGLGVQLDVDGPVVSVALARRLDDEGGTTGGEAVVALVRRGDPRALDVVAAKLTSPDVGSLYVEVAGELARRSCCRCWNTYAPIAGGRTTKARSTTHDRAMGAAPRRTDRATPRRRYEPDFGRYRPDVGVPWPLHAALGRTCSCPTAGRLSRETMGDRSGR